MERKYSRTNIFIINEDLWKWAKFRANTLGKNSVSEYLFELIKQDQKDLVLWLTQNEVDALYNSYVGLDKTIQQYLLDNPMVQELLEIYQEEDDLKVGEKEDQQ